MKTTPTTPARRPAPARSSNALPTVAALLGTALALQGCLSTAYADPVPASDAGVHPQPQPQPHPNPTPMPVPGGIGAVTVNPPLRLVR